MGGWEKENCSSIRAKINLTLSGESPAGISHCEELGQVTPSSLSPCSPSASSIVLPVLVLPAEGLDTPSLARAMLPPGEVDWPPAGEPSSMKTQPPQKLPEGPVPTLPVPGRAPGKKEQSVERPG